MTRWQTIRILCQGDTATGGPELLHQLGAELRSLGIEASMVYTPVGERVPRRPEYAHYDVPVSIDLHDEPGSLVIVPETLTLIGAEVERADVMLYWLSVDFYLQAQGDHLVLDWLRFVKYRARRVPLKQMRGWHHIAQSEYARHYLERRGVGAPIVSDYLGSAHVATDTTTPRDPHILFNPKKGAHITERLIAAYPDLRFVPIRNMTAAEVGEALRRAPLYVDFGNHPGRDRLPREAAAAGCCVVTNRQGAAGNAVDVAIPDRYKLGGSKRAIVRAFGPLATDILSDYPAHVARFESYRHEIRQQRAQFGREVAAVFG